MKVSTASRLLLLGASFAPITVIALRSTSLDHRRIIAAAISATFKFRYPGLIPMAVFLFGVGCLLGFLISILVDYVRFCANEKRERPRRTGLVILAAALPVWVTLRFWASKLLIKQEGWSIVVPPELQHIQTGMVVAAGAIIVGVAILTVDFVHRFYRNSKSHE